MSRELDSFKRNCSTTSWSESSIYYSGACGYVRLVENDEDPLRKVDLVIEAVVKARNLTSGDTTQRNVSSGKVVTYFKIDGEDERSVYSDNGKTTGYLEFVELSRQSIIATYDRTAVPQSIYGIIRVTKGQSSSGGGESVVLTIPPLKQNATFNNRHVIVKVDNVAYELLNYK